MIYRVKNMTKIVHQAVIASFLLFSAGSQLAVAQSAIEVIKSPVRTDQDRSMDEKRKPQEMLNFIQVKPGMVALDIFSAGGYTAQLMALAVGPSGKSYAFNIRPFPALEERLKEHPQTNFIPVVGALNELMPAMDGQFDVISIINSYHDLVNINPDIQTMNKRIYALLKSGGMLIIRDHAAKDGAGKSVTKTLHRIESAAVVADFESIGFQKVAEGEFLKNPQDTREEHSNKGNPPEGFIIKLIKR